MMCCAVAWRKVGQNGYGRVSCKVHAIKVTMQWTNKNSMIKFSPMRAGGKIGKNFLLVKISTYIIYSTITYS